MMDILHAGFDGLTINLSSVIPEGFAEELASAKAHAKETHTDCILEFGNIKLSVTQRGRVESGRHRAQSATSFVKREISL
jgi:hypothetical protein